MPILAAALGTPDAIEHPGLSGEGEIKKRPHLLCEQCLHYKKTGHWKSENSIEEKQQKG